MTSPTVQELLDACAVLGALSERARNYSRRVYQLDSEAAMMAAQLSLASLYLAEYARELTRGVEADEALGTVLRGDTPLSPEAKAVATAALKERGKGHH